MGCTDGTSLPVFAATDEEHVYQIVFLVFCLLSVVAALTVITSSFYCNGIKSFFSWSKGSRFIVYLATYDFLYHLVTGLNHIYYVAFRDHVPVKKCIVYAFFILQFSSAQALLLNLVAIHAYVQMKRETELSLGPCDCYLLVYCTFTPVIVIAVGIAYDQLGYNGVTCVLDGCIGDPALVVRTSFLGLVFLVNVVLFWMVWRKLRPHTILIDKRIRKKTKTEDAVRRASKGMLMLVTTYFIQWWALIMEGIWTLTYADPPVSVKVLYILFCEIGGMLDLMVYYIIYYPANKDRLKERRASSLPHENHHVELSSYNMDDKEQSMTESCNNNRL